MNVSDSLIIISHPSFGWVDLPEFFLLRNVQGLTSSHHFSHNMARSLTPTDPPESFLYDSFVLASTGVKVSPSVLITFTMLI